MAKPLSKMLREFRLHWRAYFAQALLATLATLIVLLLLKFQDAVIIASIGSTAFTVFAIPNNLTAQPRNVVGGQLVGLFSGSLCAMIPQPYFLSSAAAYSLAVGLSFLIMVVTDTEHPPASGTALGVAISGFSVRVAVAVLTSAVALSLAHRLLRTRLRDLA